MEIKDRNLLLTNSNPNGRAHTPLSSSFPMEQ